MVVREVVEEMVEEVGLETGVHLVVLELQIQEGEGVVFIVQDNIQGVRVVQVS